MPSHGRTCHQLVAHERMHAFFTCKLQQRADCTQARYMHAQRAVLQAGYLHWLIGAYPVKRSLETEL